MKNIASIHINSEKTDCRTMCLVNVVNVSAREMIEVNESGIETSVSKERIPLKNEKKNDRIRGVISWGDREYDIDEFRSLLLKGPVDIMEEGRDET